MHKGYYYCMESTGSGSCLSRCAEYAKERVAVQHSCAQRCRGSPPIEYNVQSHSPFMRQRILFHCVLELLEDSGLVHISAIASVAK